MCLQCSSVLVILRSCAELQISIRVAPDGEKLLLEAAAELPAQLVADVETARRGVVWLLRKRRQGWDQSGRVALHPLCEVWLSRLDWLDFQIAGMKGEFDGEGPGKKDSGQAA